MVEKIRFINREMKLGEKRTEVSIIEPEGAYY